MDIQRLRNLTTGVLHTNITHVYQDIEFLVGTKGIMSYMLPNANRALEPFLREKTDSRFWDNKYDLTHVGELEIVALNETQKAESWETYNKLPSLLG